MRAASLALALLLCAGPKAGFAAEAASPDPGALFRQGKVAFDAGRLEEALSAFTRAYELSSHPELLLNMAQCERGLGRRGDAIRLFEQFIAIAPEHRLRPAAERTLVELRAAPPPDAPTNVTTRPVSAPEDVVPSQALRPAEAAPDARAPEISTWLWVGAGIGAVLLAGGAVAWVATRPQPPPTIGTLELPRP